MRSPVLERAEAELRVEEHRIARLEQKLRRARERAAILWVKVKHLKAQERPGDGS